MSWTRPVLSRVVSSASAPSHSPNSGSEREERWRGNLHPGHSLLFFDSPLYPRLDGHPKSASHHTNMEHLTVAGY